MNTVHINFLRGDMMPKILNNVKEDICRVSRSMLSEEGYENLSIRNIAKNCGIGMGTIYNYFKSKDDIIFDIIMEDWTTILGRMDRSIKSDMPMIDKLESLHNLLKEFVGGFHGMWMDMATSKAKKTDYKSLKSQRMVYSMELHERISSVTLELSSTMEKDELDFLNSTLTTIFLSNDKFEFKTLEKILNRLSR